VTTRISESRTSTPSRIPLIITSRSAPARSSARSSSRLRSSARSGTTTAAAFNSSFHSEKSLPKIAPDTSAKKIASRVRRFHTELTSRPDATALDRKSRNLTRTDIKNRMRNAE
jgi:hypothetical protein